MATRYGEWEVVESLDEGAQGRLFKVKDTTSRHPGDFALTRLKDDRRRERFQREAEALDAARHPNVIRIVAAHTDGASPYYFVTPYYPGNMEDQGAVGWDVKRKFDFFARILDGMAHIHQQKIVHRDIKPQNILVDGDGRPVIADFGICYTEDGQQLTITGDVMGPRDFTAPELEEGEEPASSADVYSLGKLLFWLITGKRVPREAHREQKYDLSRLHGEPRYELLNRMLDKMLVRDPRGRLPTATDALVEFNKVREVFDRTINVPSRTGPQRCIFCGVGSYRTLSEPDADGNTDKHKNQQASLALYGDVEMRVMFCDTCANVQLFSPGKLRSKEKPNIWTR